MPWLGLDEPEWAVTTAFVLSTPKFVGAIGEKTVLRIGGALVGALSILLVAWLLPHLALPAGHGNLTNFTTTMCRLPHAVWLSASWLRPRWWRPADCFNPRWPGKSEWRVVRKSASGSR